MQEEPTKTKLKKYCEELKQKINLNNKILFIKPLEFNLDFFEEEVAKNRCYYAYQPMGLQYLTLALEGRGLETKIFDLNYEVLKKLKEDKDFKYKDWMTVLKNYFTNNNPSIIGVSNASRVETLSFRKILGYLKEKNKIILAGGQNATYEGKELLNEGLCHFVLQREAENKINFLFDNLFETKNTKPTPGILFKYNNKIEETDGERDIVKLKGNLINAYKLLPMENYYKYGSLNAFSRIAGKDIPYATLIFSRGCQANCKFCGVRDYMGPGYRTRNIEDVLDEIEYLYKEKGIKYFEFVDDNPSGDKNKFSNLLQGIINRNLKINWSQNNGFIARTLDYNLMDKIRDSGCIGFRIGVESGNPEVLKRTRKPGNLKSFREFSQLAQKYPEIVIVDNYMLGFPEENFKQIKQTYNFSLEMNLDWGCFSVYQHNITYFGDKEEKEKQGNKITDFIPTRDSFKGRLDSSEKIYTGLNIFKIPEETIPSKEQLDQIWITMDFSRNFVHNKNLKINPKKFISLVSAIQPKYPSHPYINLYLGLAYNLIENYNEAKNQYNKMRHNLQDTYWQERFDNLQLTEVANKFPKTPEQTKKAINHLIDKYDGYL